MITEEMLIIKSLVDRFLESEQRKLMVKGHDYYIVDNDIIHRNMIRYDENQNPIVDKSKTNNRLAHGFMFNLVSDKVNYLLSKPYTLDHENKAYLEKIKEVLGPRFQKTLSRLGTDASNKGVSWLMPYISPSGQFKTLLVPGEQVYPIWVDNSCEELEGALRIYDEEYYEGTTPKIRTKVEYWLPNGVKYFLISDGTIVLDAETYLDYPDSEDGLVGHFLVNGKPDSWGKVPLVPFKNNDLMLPDLKFVKSLIDNYDLTRSDVANTLEEIKNVVFALRGYGGESLATFMRDLSYYKAIKLEDDGGMDTYSPNLDITAAKEHYESLRKDIFDFGLGVDKNSDKLGNSPSGIALKFIYSGLDLKCNTLEEWFLWGYHELLYFVRHYLSITNQGNFPEEGESIVFNRDIQINESESIDNCNNSTGLISQETIVKNHPWVTDYELELERLKEEKAESLKKQQELFGNGFTDQTLEDEGEEEEE